MFYARLLSPELIVLMLCVFNFQINGLSAEAFILKNGASVTSLEALKEIMNSLTSNVTISNQTINSPRHTGSSKNFHHANSSSSPKPLALQSLEALKEIMKSLTPNVTISNQSIDSVRIKDSSTHAGSLKNFYHTNSSSPQNSTKQLVSDGKSSNSRVNLRLLSLKDLSKLLASDVKLSSVGSSKSNPKHDSGCYQSSELLHSCGPYTEELGEAEHRMAVENGANALTNEPRNRRSVDVSQDSARMRISNKIKRLNRMIDEARRQKNLLEEESNLIPVKMKDVNRLSLSHTRTRERNKYKDPGEYKIQDIVSETLAPDINIDAIKGGVTNLKEETAISDSEYKGSNSEKKGAIKKEDQVSTTRKISNEHVIKDTKKSKEEKKDKDEKKPKEETKDKDEKKPKKEKKLIKEKKCKESKLFKVLDKHKGKHRVVKLGHLKPKDAKETVSLENENDVRTGTKFKSLLEETGSIGNDGIENTNCAENDSQDSDYATNNGNLEDNSNDNNLIDMNMLNQDIVPANPRNEIKENSLYETNNRISEGNNDVNAIEEYESDTQNDHELENLNINGGNPGDTALTENEPTNSGETIPDQTSGHTSHIKTLAKPNNVKMCDCKPCPTKCTTPCTTKCTTPSTTCKCNPQRVLVCVKSTSTPQTTSCPVCNFAELSDRSDSTNNKDMVNYKGTNEDAHEVVGPSNQVSLNDEDPSLSTDLAIPLTAEDDSSILQLSREMHGINSRLERIIQIIRDQKKAHEDAMAEENSGQRDGNSEEKAVAEEKSGQPDEISEQKAEETNKGNVASETDSIVQTPENTKLSNEELDKPSATVEDFQRNLNTDHQNIAKHKTNERKVTYSESEDGKKTEDSGKTEVGGKEENVPAQNESFDNTYDMGESNERNEGIRLNSKDRESNDSEELDR